MQHRSRVLVAEDRLQKAHELSALLQPEFDVVVTGSDRDAFLHAVEEFRPDVIVSEVTLPSLLGVPAREILHRNPSAKLVIVSPYGDRETARAALAAGALGLVLKSTAAVELPRAIRAAKRGERYFSESLRRRPAAETMQ
jgi:DNA-binding NarL/FixJ family response regulator